MKITSKTLALTAVMTALCAVATYVVAIPFPSGVGYFNLGDVLVLLAGWLLGPVWGGLAAALGSMLADFLAGYAVYAPATFVIKGLVAAAGWGLYTVAKKAIRKDGIDFLPRLLSGLIAECIMVLGYLLYEAVVLGYGAAALASVLGNGLQAVCGCIGAVALMAAMYPVPAVRRLFPAFSK